MKHEKALRLLTEKQTWELGAKNKARLEDHLETCQECGSLAETYHLLSSILGEEGSETLTAHPQSELLARFAVKPTAVNQRHRMALRIHLRECPDCRHQLKLSRAAIKRARRSSHFTEVSQFIVPNFAPKRRLVMGTLALIAAVAGSAALIFHQQGANPAEEHLSGVSLEGTQVIEAGDALRATEVKIESGATVTFRAGEVVAFGEGFFVDSRASLTVETTADSSHEKSQ